MERETWARAGMVVTILALLALILITPNLLGRPPELASLPVLVIGMTGDGSALVVDVSGAVQAYMYANITLGVRDTAPNGTVNATLWENDTYGVHLRVPANESARYLVHTRLVDRQRNVFEYNVTAHVGEDADGRTIISVSLSDEPSGGEQIRVPPDDFRIAVPLRGSE